MEALGLIKSGEAFASSDDHTVYQEDADDSAATAPTGDPWDMVAPGVGTPAGTLCRWRGEAAVGCPSRRLLRTPISIFRLFALS